MISCSYSFKILLLFAFNESKHTSALVPTKNSVYNESFPDLFASGLRIFFHVIYLSVKRKQRLKDCHRQDWDAKNPSGDRYLRNPSFKQSFCLKEYLIAVEIKKFRDVLIPSGLEVTT